MANELTIKAAEIAQQVGFNPAAHAPMAYLHKILREGGPSAVRSFRDFCKREGAVGRTLRVRPAWRYSTVYLTWSAAGVPPTRASANLYSVPIGIEDSQLGRALTTAETNATQAGKMDAKQQLIASKMGFRAFVQNPGSASPSARLLMLTVQAVYRHVAPVLNMGPENIQRWPPIVEFPLPEVRFAGRAGEIAVGVFADDLEVEHTAVGEREIRDLKPNIVINANESQTVELDWDVANLPSDASLANVQIAVYHEFAGRTRTGVVG